MSSKRKLNLRNYENLLLSIKTLQDRKPGIRVYEPELFESPGSDPVIFNKVCKTAYDGFNTRICIMLLY